MAEKRHIHRRNLGRTSERIHSKRWEAAEPSELDLTKREGTLGKMLSKFPRYQGTHLAETNFNF